MAKVYLSSVRASAPDASGARAIVIGENETLVFEGSGRRCSAYLKTHVPVGVSVAVRHSKGIRSCMNKPGLWADCRGYI